MANLTGGFLALLALSKAAKAALLGLAIPVGATLLSLRGLVDAAVNQEVKTAQFIWRAIFSQSNVSDAATVVASFMKMILLGTLVVPAALTSKFVLVSSYSGLLLLISILDILDGGQDYNVDLEGK